MGTFPLEPLGNYLIVKLMEEKEKVTEGGIFIPEKAQQKTPKGVVVAVGPGQRGLDGNFVAPQCKVGDKVYFGRYATVSLEYDELKMFFADEPEKLELLDPKDKFVVLSDGEIFVRAK